MVVLIDSIWDSSKLGDPADWLRRELEVAIKRGMMLVPVVLDHNRMPSAEELPTSVALLARTQAFFVDGRSDSIFAAAIGAVAQHILTTNRATIELRREPEGWWNRMDTNLWSLYIDERSLLSLSYAETLACATVATGPHAVEIHWIEKERDTRYGQAYGPGYSSMGSTERQKVVVRPGVYTFMMARGIDTRGFWRKVGDFFSAGDSIPRHIEIRYREAV